jgi:hypothetical protein
VLLLQGERQVLFVLGFGWGSVREIRLGVIFGKEGRRTLTSLTTLKAFV